MSIYDEAIQRVAKWRSVFVSWQLGTRRKDDPEASALRDHREVTILLRVECNAIARILIEKGIVSQDDFTRVVAEEAEHLNLAYEQKFPGFTAQLDGIHIDLPEGIETMKRFAP